MKISEVASAVTRLHFERIKAARKFGAALRDKTAKDLALACMAKSYAEGIMAYSLVREELQTAKIREHCQGMWGHIFSYLESLSGHPETLFERLFPLRHEQARWLYIWYHLFYPAFCVYKGRVPVQDVKEHVSPFIRGESVVDIGCGSGKYALTVRGQNPALRVAGIDVDDGRRLGMELEFYLLDLRRPFDSLPQAFDSGLLRYVLHHVSERDKGIFAFLEGVKRVVRRRLIVFEDILITPSYSTVNVPGIEEIDALKRSNDLFDRYVSMPAASQKAFLILMDVLIIAFNYGLAGIHFPYGFRSVSEWESIFREAGFRLRRFKPLVFEPGRFSQSVHGLFILDL